MLWIRNAETVMNDLAENVSPVISVQNVSVAFGGEQRKQVTFDVSFDIRPGEFFALVGESGSGKSVTAMSLLGLLPRPSAQVISGSAIFHGEDLLQMKPVELRRIRGKKISVIFQEPMQALDPVRKIKSQLLEAIPETPKKEALEKIRELLQSAGFSDLERVLNGYPCEMSGGMLQRICIVMALVSEPDLIIADEPTTALDVTVQAAVLNLLKQMANQSQTAVLLITHNMGLVAQYTDRVAVMFNGRIVETGTSRNVILHPQADYTKKLIAAIPQ